MRIATFLIAIVTLLVVGQASGQAQGTSTVTFSTGPEPGTNAGEIKFTGKVTPDKDNGWEVVAGTFSVVIIPVGSGQKYLSSSTIAADGTFSTVVAGLSTNLEYWVIQDGMVKKGTDVKAISSDPTKGKTK